MIACIYNNYKRIQIRLLIITNVGMLFKQLVIFFIFKLQIKIFY